MIGYLDELGRHKLHRSHKLHRRYKLHRQHKLRERRESNRPKLRWACRLRRPRGSLLRDEDGITTVSMAICIFLSLALMFSAGQLYKVSSASTEVQDVADAAALAAENEVAHFMVAAQTCDAVVLTMTLTAGITYGLGIVAACVPLVHGISAKLIELGTKVVKARGKFADAASEGLNNLQKLLPFLSAANAARVASMNNNGVMDAQYYAAALLVPLQGESIGNLCDDGLDEASSRIEESAEELRSDAAEAEKAAEKANEYKHEAFMRDCGDSPNYCMYERASKLVDLAGGENPHYSSEDAWSFSVALKRAQAYYMRRAQIETISGASVEDRADSALRKRFYEYARDLLNSEGYVYETPDGYSCNFPTLFHNLEEFRETPLYTQNSYPVTDSNGSACMHAWEGCPNASGYSRYGSVSELESGGFAICDLCEFQPKSMANVAAASTSVNNGFEYHYAAVAKAASDYSEAMEELGPKKKAVQDLAGSLLDGLKAVLSAVGGDRIEAHPPGEDGVIALVVNTAQNSSDAGFESLFVGGQTLGVRAAVSGAKLEPDKSSEDGTVITSLLEGFAGSSGGAVGAGRVVLDCWSSLLKAYQDGQAALDGALKDGLNSFSTNTASGLGTWASKALSEVIKGCGLQPADLSIKKPILINTAHVVENDSGALSVRYSQIKQSALAASSSSTSLFSSLIDGLQSAIDSTGITNGTITIATIDFPVGDISIPIKLTLPQPVVDGANSFIDSCMGYLRSAVASVTGARVWQ